MKKINLISLIVNNIRLVPWEQMLRNIILEKYEGKRMQKIEVNFISSKEYRLSHYKIPNEILYYTDYLRYNALLDMKVFRCMSFYEQIRFIWDKACKYIIVAAEATANQSLADSCCYAHVRGLELNLNPDYYALNVPVKLYGKSVLARIRIEYNHNWQKFFLWHQKVKFLMTAFLILEDDGKMRFKQKLCTKSFNHDSNIEYFKKVEVKNENILLIKGCHLDCLPLEIFVSEDIICKNN